MNRNLLSLFACLLSVLSLPAVVRAQDESRAAWQGTNFDITVGISEAERATERARHRLPCAMSAAPPERR